MRTPIRCGLWSLSGAGAVVVAALATPVPAQETTRVSLAWNDSQANNGSTVLSDRPAISGDGRHVAFSCWATNLVPGDVNNTADIFDRNRFAGSTGRLTLAIAFQLNGFSYYPSSSRDGRQVAFASLATNLVAGDTNGRIDLFVRDRDLDTTERVSVDSSGVQGDDDSYIPSISRDGRYVAFYSFATNLVSGDTNATADVLVRDRLAGTTERVSVDSSGVEGNGGSAYASISDDGRFVAFYSAATNLVAGDTNGVGDVFVRDRLSGTTERVSLDSGAAEANGISTKPSLSGDGRYVAFESEATNLVAGDANAWDDVFLRDRLAGTTERLSLDSGGAEGDDDSRDVVISADGSYVAFASYASNLVPGDTNGDWDIFWRDRLAGTTVRVSVDSDGFEANYHSQLPSISDDGLQVAFMSDATNLVAGDTNGDKDIFVHDRSSRTKFTSLCDPGSSGVIPCPCSNPPSGSGQGCDNSSSTGGAILSATGKTFLSSDSLVFTTSGEKPTALSILAQWTGTSATGVVFGMGVRCTSGTLKRLYTRSAVGGSITAPNLGAGDPPVSARSAALGDPIIAGQSRWYLVYYRDPIVLGGCPATSTFNATQTGQVAWWP